MGPRELGKRITVRDGCEGGGVIDGWGWGVGIACITGAKGGRERDTCSDKYL